VDETTEKGVEPLVPAPVPEPEPEPEPEPDVKEWALAPSDYHKDTSNESDDNEEKSVYQTRQEQALAEAKQAALAQPSPLLDVVAAVVERGHALHQKKEQEIQDLTEAARVAAEAAARKLAETRREGLMALQTLRAQHEEELQ
jgi:hypothetical protein